MRHRPWFLGRILAVLLLAVGGPACAQILGDDYEIEGDSEGGGDDCGSNTSCDDCVVCVAGNECSSAYADCEAHDCWSFGDCCASGYECGCDQKESLYYALEDCAAAVCSNCTYSSGGGS